LENAQEIDFGVRSFFRNASKLFVIMMVFARLCVTKASLAKLKEALGDVVLIAIQTDQPISFMETCLDKK